MLADSRKIEWMDFTVDPIDLYEHEDVAGLLRVDQSMGYDL